ncbi:MAG: hypothetical protein AAB421_01395 [Patescibacteria group bacterium]
MGNTHFKPFAGLTAEAHSVVVLVSFFGCQCDSELLKGAHRGTLLDMLRRAVEGAGFGVIGESIQPFGMTTGEQVEHGATINLVLADSGISFDCYPDAQPVHGTVQMNLHYCNITNDNDHKVKPCIEAIEQVFRPRVTQRYPRMVMPINVKAALDQEYEKLPR